MKHRIGTVAVLGLSWILAAPTAAEEFVVLGSRQLGMGGAGVATTRGGLSTYWNPAGLAAPRTSEGIFGGWDAELHFEANGGAVGDVLSSLDAVFDTVDELDFGNLDSLLDDPGSLLTDEQIQNVLRLVTEELPALGDEGTGLTVNGSVGAAGRIGYFGLAATGLAYGGGLTSLDLSSLALGDEGIAGILGGGQDRSGSLSPDGQALADQLAGQGLASQNQAEELVYQAELAGLDPGNTGTQDQLEDLLSDTQDNIGGSADEFLTSNSSGVNLRGILLQEYAVGFAYPFFDMFSIGVAGKLMYGQTFFQPFTLNDLLKPGDLVDELFDSLSETEDSVNFGVDVGALFQPVDFLSIGIVGRNLNSPEFDFAGPGNYKIEPQVRTGVGVNLPLGLTLAADLDLIENESQALKGYKSQILGGGIEWSILDTVLLRGGLSQNVADFDESVVVHAGVAAQFLGVSLDVSGMVSTEFTDIGGEDVPERAGLALFFGINVPLD